jgi:hypothetical protein
MTSTAKEQSNSEKIRSLIHTVKPDTVFKSYRDLCKFFGINYTGGNAKDAVNAELSRCCTWKKKGRKIIITNVYDSSQPKIDERFLSSKYYPMCGYLLLVSLAERYNQDEYEKCCYLTKREIMGVISICNEYYSEAYSNAKSIEEKSNKDSESEYFIKVASSYLYKLSQRILSSLQRRNFLTFDEVTMVKYMSEEAREATDEEARLLNDYYSVILEKYSLKSINAIWLRNDKKEIYKDIDERLGFKHYNAIKFNLTCDLASNAEHLQGVANLTDNCTAVVNSLVCNKLYSLVFDGIVSIRNDEPKQVDVAQLIREFKPELFEERIDKMIAEFTDKGVVITDKKFVKRYGFNSDDDIVVNRIESLINELIRVDVDG